MGCKLRPPTEAALLHKDAQQGRDEQRSARPGNGKADALWDGSRMVEMRLVDHARTLPDSGSVADLYVNDTAQW